MVLDFSGFEQAKHEDTERHSWTKLRSVYLGDGATPPTVVVPTAKRQNEGEVYWYDESVDGKEIGVAIDDAGVSGYSNNYAGIRIRVGYPPGITDFLYVYPGVAREGLKQTGGITPINRTIYEQSIIVPERYQELRLEPDSGLTPKVLGGRWRSGETAVIWSEASGPDLTSYVPSTAGKAKWVLVSQTSAGAFTVTAGSEVNDSQQAQDSHFPATLPDGELQIAWVKLVTGMTDLANATILQLANIPAIFSSAAGLSLQPTVINSDYTVPADYEAIWSTGYRIGTGSLTNRGSIYIIK